MRTGLHWFRADLRVTDNTALAAAMQDCDQLFAVYIITGKTWAKHDAAPIKIQFILQNLVELSASCAKLGIPLFIRECDYFSESPAVLQDIITTYHIDALYYNKQYEFDEMRRDLLVAKKLAGKLAIFDHDDQLIMPPGSVLSQQQKPLQIFTPFKKVWLKKVDELEAWHPIKSVTRKFSNTVQADAVPKTVKGFADNFNLAHWPAGEKAALLRLEKFCANDINYYHERRDFPSLAGTSQLSPYLAQGVISPAQCVDTIMSSLNLHNFQAIQQHPGAATWVSELIWREFYKHILFFHPGVCRYKPFKPDTDKIPWRYDEADFGKWCEGKTGFPLVDAAMRQLNQTGWMHNRLRMVVAMFLSKTLFIDWRWGEKYFMQQLIDGDLAANNGGWQWSASTGTDAVPYFRIFNPVTQSERFDPNGDFIRQFCPELAHLDNKTIHIPQEPIVDYKVMRAKVIAAFKLL